jgi:methyl-accepting chemotaxis protein
MSSGTAPSNSSKAQPLPHIRPARKRSGNLLMNVSIGTRLTLGFIIAALIAAVVTGALGFQRAQSVNNQSNFYLNLLQSNNNLTTGEQFLQEINAVTQNILVLANAQQLSQETLRNNLNSLQNLDNLYSGTLASFINDQLVSKHPDEKVLLDEANHSQQIHQQETLAASTLRTWQAAHTALGQFVADVTAGHFDTAALLQQALVEPTNADALTSLRSLVNFNKKLASSVKDAADVEASDQLIITIVSSVIAFIAILFIGWLISGTLVRRLQSLRQVTQAVENGELTKRVKVIGRDEIADVSASVNAMLDAISNLVNETRSQHDALMNAAEHLFSDMRVVSAGDLRVNAPVSNDPIGMLANAFNFTIGRFRRFVLHTKTLSEQLSVIAQREVERAQAFSQAVQSIPLYSDPQQMSPSTIASSSAHQEKHEREDQVGAAAQLMTHIHRTREHLRRITEEGILNHTHVAGELYEQITQTLKRLSKISNSEIAHSQSTNVAIMTNLYVQELRTLSPLITRIAAEVQHVQRNTIKGFKNLDQGLQQISLTLETKNQGSVETASSLSLTEQDLHLQDTLRLGVTFAHEVTTLSHQLLQLGQEIQNSIVSFQLDFNPQQERARS